MLGYELNEINIKKFPCNDGGESIITSGQVNVWRNVTKTLILPLHYHQGAERKTETSSLLIKVSI